VRQKPVNFAADRIRLQMKKTNRRISSLLLLLLATVALLTFGVFTNVLTDIWGHNIKAAFQNNPVLIAAFALLLGLVGYLYTKIENRSEKPAPEAVDKDQYEEALGKFKELLKEQYQIRLNSKTGHRLPINLTARPSHFGTSRERVRSYFKDKNLSIENENIASEIGNILETHRRLLLIGDLGVGKTTILLYAAINILNDARTPKLPLLLNLVTWTKGRDFAEWYTQNIAHTYSLSPVFVRELLRCNAVVPFFDGFDEVAEKYRDDCFRQMAAYFGDQSTRQLIVSSRKKEYAAAKADAPVYAEIEVQPLSLAQIKKALSENAQSQAADDALLYALEHDKWLAGVVETPFYLNTASFLFGKGQRTLADFSFQANSTEGRQAELVEIFVAEQVAQEQDRKYLHFLARKMNTENFLVFELVRMQPGWSGRLRLYWLVLGLILGLAFTLTFPSTLSKKLTNNNFVIALIATLAAGLIIGVVFVWHNRQNWLKKNPIVNIETQDIQKWYWKKFIKNWKTILGSGLVCIATGLVIGSLDKLVNGITFGIASFVSILIYFGTMTNFLLYVHSPYQRFLATILNYFWQISIIILSICVGIGVSAIWEGRPMLPVLQDWAGKAGWWPFCQFGLLLLCFLSLFSQFLQHFSLRLVLFLEGKIPLRVVTFMDRMSEQLIFEDNRRKDKKGRKRRGATWRFRHKILQDYFAGHP